MTKRGRPPHDDVLTPREWEVLSLIRDGLSNDQIASRLGISLDGVKYHVSEILGKLGLENRHDAARWRPEERRAWALAPLSFWRRLDFGWVTGGVLVIVVIAAAAGSGLVLWGMQRGSEETASADGTLRVARMPLAAGGEHTCVVTQSGGVECWGANESGQLGIGTPSFRSVPQKVVQLPDDIVAVAAGGSHTCALTAEGEVWCWGKNSSGQLGDTYVIDRSVPARVKGFGRKVVAIGAGFDYNCALEDIGQVMCWGDNTYGQLGEGSTHAHRQPVSVEGLDHGVVAISAGGYHACALLGDTSVQCWGRNWEGQLGDNKPTITSWDARRVISAKPVRVTNEDGTELAGAAAISAGGGYGHACALIQNGNVTCWGSNTWGELGDGKGSEGYPWYRAVAVATLGLSGVALLSAGGTDGQGGHTCAITSTRAIFCWGRGYEGQLGDGIADNANLGGSITPEPVLGLGLDATAIVAGARHTCAIMVSGQVKCWGENEAGQLGLLAPSFSNLPLDVTGVAAAVR